jgi:hypothetical protein
LSSDADPAVRELVAARAKAKPVPVDEDLRRELEERW